MVENQMNVKICKNCPTLPKDSPSNCIGFKNEAYKYCPLCGNELSFADWDTFEKDKKVLDRLNHQRIIRIGS